MLVKQRIERQSEPSRATGRDTRACTDSNCYLFERGLEREREDHGLCSGVGEKRGETLTSPIGLIDHWLDDATSGIDEPLQREKESA